MGHHFVPQRYLKGFEDPQRPDFIWLHDRFRNTASHASIEKSLQSRDYYPPETETLLAQRVEIPGNAAIAAIRAGESIDLQQKSQLAYYIAVMMGRVPTQRKIIDRLLPDQLDGAIARVRTRLETVAADSDAPPEQLKAKLAELDEIETRYRSQLPRDLFDEAYSPWPSQEVVEHIFRMNWRILNASGPQYFVTTDNPVFFFTELGLANPNVELCFPLATTHALHASWRPVSRSREHVTATQRVVKEFNRRLASKAERIAVYHDEASWLLGLLARKEHSYTALSWEPPPNKRINTTRKRLSY